MNVNKMGIVVVGALAAAAFGVGSGVAHADASVIESPGVAWKLDRDDWDDDWRGWDNRRWDGPRWDGPRYGGPCAWVPPAVSMWVPPAVC